MENLTGKKFGRLTVIDFAGIDKNRNSLWLCKCDCGNEKVILRNSLITGKTKSCGCLQREKAAEAQQKHGMCNSRIYRIYRDMVSRCYYDKADRFANYGQRGIRVCDEWLNSFEVFYQWATLNGYADDLTIDRINVNGNYEPSNCRWVTMKEQSRNKRNNHLLIYKNESKTIAEWAEILEIKQNTLYQRIKRGKTLEEIFEGK